MRFLTLFLLAAVLVTTPAHAGAPRLANIGRIDGLLDIFLRNGAVVVRAEAGDYEIATLPGGKLALAPVAPPEVVPVPSDIIPHAKVIEGGRNIRAAWLAGPTKRYSHGVLGDAVEASALKVELADGAIVSLELGEESVFEDLTPRIADLDGDGRDEIIVVRSYPGRGAAVAVYRLTGRALFLQAESDPIGQAFRWLNPARSARPFAGSIRPARAISTVTGVSKSRSCKPRISAEFSSSTGSRATGWWKSPGKKGIRPTPWARPFSTWRRFST